MIIKNICLIGLPYSGKSRLGKLYSQNYNMGFIETDLMLQYKYNDNIKNIIKKNGINNFLKLENKIGKTIHCDNTIISTGGSMVYNNDALYHFKNNLNCYIIHLYLTYNEFVNRVDNLENRGVININNLSLIDLYNERINLCNNYSDKIINVDDINKFVKKLT